MTNTQANTPTITAKRISVADLKVVPLPADFLASTLLFLSFRIATITKVLHNIIAQIKVNAIVKYKIRNVFFLGSSGNWKAEHLYETVLFLYRGFHILPSPACGKMQRLEMNKNPTRQTKDHVFFVIWIL